MSHLLQTMDQFPGTKVLVVGDLMLDRYTWGDAERVSPEAPVLVLRAETEEVRLGGAASVAGLLRGLDAHVSVAGVIGADGNGRVLQRLLCEADIDASLVCCESERRTTTKERFLGRTMNRRANQILRVDSEHRHLIDRATEERLIEGMVQRLPQFASVLISDYAKGVCTPYLLRRVIDSALEHGVGVIVDPGRGVDYQRYSGAAILKPNRIEAESAAGISIHSPTDALTAARKLCEKISCQAVVITLDFEGIAVWVANGTGESFPTQIRDVCDITGAGDTVLAVLGLCLSNQLSICDAARIANLAAGLQVEREGVAIVTRTELVRELTRQLKPTPARESPSPSGKLVTREEMIQLAETYRWANKKVVFTNGCFDLLHIGHVTFLRQAAALGHVLVVALNSDMGVRRLKGPTRPVIGQHDRAAMLAALACVDHVLIFDEDTPHALLHAIRPHVLVKGGTTTKVIGREVIEASGGHVCVLDQVQGVSTTNLLASIKETACE